MNPTPIYLTSALQKLLADKGVTNYAPAYGGASAGLDLYNAGGTRIYYPPAHTVAPHEGLLKTLLNTGIKLAIPSGWVGLIQERGSIVKSPLKLRAGVIDADYRGIVFVNAVNVGAEPYFIEPKVKTPFQLIIVPCNNKFAQVAAEEYERLAKDSQRGSSCLGSSD